MNSLLILAIRELGHKSSIKSNLELSACYQEIKKTSQALVDHSLWSCAFINWITNKAGLNFKKQATPLNWLSLGQEVDNEPDAGDLVISERKVNDTTQYFASLYVWRSTDNELVYCLGGDENHEVSVKAIPANNIIGFRRVSYVTKQAAV